MKQVYDLYAKNDFEQIGESRYFFTSRTAMNLAVADIQENIWRVYGKLTEDPGLNVRDFIWKQFRVQTDDDLNQTYRSLLEQYGEERFKSILHGYDQQIIDTAGEYKANYLKYLSALNISGKQVKIVDIVTQGTLVSGLSYLLQKKVGLIAMGTSSFPNQFLKEEDDVCSVFGNVTEKEGDFAFSTSGFSDLHLFLELLYASRDGQTLYFDYDGNPVFQPSEYDSGLLLGVQRELLFLFEWFKGHFSKRFSLACLNLLRGRFSIVDGWLKEQFSFDDPFDASRRQCNLFDNLF